MVVKASTVSLKGTDIDSEPHTDQRSFKIAFETICFCHRRGASLRFDLRKQLAQG